jgi:hypothetical protein
MDRPRPRVLARLLRRLCRALVIRCVGRISTAQSADAGGVLGGLPPAFAGFTRLKTASEIPRANELKTCRFKVRQVPGRQAPAVDPCNGRDHSVGRGHGSALSERCAHDVAVGECRGFREREDPVGKTVAPRGQPLLQASGPLVGANFPDAEGDLGNGHRRQCQLCVVTHEPGDHSGVWRLTQRLRDDVGVEEDQSSGPGLIFRVSRMTTSRSRSLP